MHYRVTAIRTTAKDNCTTTLVDGQQFDTLPDAERAARTVLSGYFDTTDLTGPYAIDDESRVLTGTDPTDGAFAVYVRL